MNRKVIVTIITAIGLLLFNNVFSDELRFSRIETEAIGFNNTTITTLVFDNNNALWVVAANQIFEYNNNVWIEHDKIHSDIDYFKTPRNTGICNMMIGGSFFARDIKVSNNNHIWLSTDSGLVEYDRRKWSLYSREVEKKRSFGKVDCFDIDHNNTAWVVYGTTIYRLINGIYEEYYSILDKNARDIIPRKFAFHCLDLKCVHKYLMDEHLLLGTSWGVLRFDISGKRMRNVTPFSIEQPYPVYSINTEDNDTFYFTCGGEVAKMKESQYMCDWSITTLSDLHIPGKKISLNSYIGKICFTPHHERLLVIGDLPNRILYTDKDSFIELNFSTSKRINDVVVSKDGTIWIATDKGLFQSYLMWNGD